MPGIKRKRGLRTEMIETEPSQNSALIGSGAAGSAVDLDLKTSKVDLTKRRTLFVRSLGPETTQQTLLEHFSNQYPLKHATLVVDSGTKKSKGFGFVTVADAQDAQAAVKELNGSQLDGKKIRVEIAEPRHREEGNRSAVAVASTVSRERRAERRVEQKPPRLIVRNLPWSVKEPQDLEKLFLSFGKVKNVTIPKGRAGLQSGFGFVTIRGKKNAEKAIEKINGTEVDGRTIAVDWAVEKEVYEKETEKSATGKEESSTKKSEVATATSNSKLSPTDVASEIVDADTEIDVEKFLADADLEDEEEANESEIESDLAQLETDEESSLEGDSELDIITGEAADEDANDPPVKVHPEEEQTLFVRNLPYSSTDESLSTQFLQFGPLRYARVVMDHATQRPKGTGFVCFYNANDLESCLKQAPRPDLSGSADRRKPTSVLQDERTDPFGLYTMDGRVLHVSQAVSKSEASKLAETGSSARMSRDRDRRRLYLLMEGTVSTKSPLHSLLAPSEVKMREASLAQRKKLIGSNPSLNLSLTRLSVRNMPRTIDSKALKQLARDAVVGFAKDVKAGSRERISKEELGRDAGTMAEAEKHRKARGKGVVKQAKVVFEGARGEKIREDKETAVVGRSRGYGFIEYSSHRWALMGLRWLNGYAAGKVKAAKNGEDAADGKKRLIVEFAIENAGVVKRRMEMERKSGQRPRKEREREKTEAEEDTGTHAGKRLAKKRRTEEKVQEGVRKEKEEEAQGVVEPSKERLELAKRQQIIARKRMKRRQGRK